MNIHSLQTSPSPQTHRLSESSLSKHLQCGLSILSFYTRQIVPRITKAATVQLAASKQAKGIIGDDEYEDDENYGSAATLDVEVLQAISKRVRYGTSTQPPPQTTGSVELTVSPSPLTCYQNDLGPYDSVPPFTAS